MSSGWRLERSLYVPGVALLPEDFPERLTAVKELTGLSWWGVSDCLGVDYRQLWRWRFQGTVPSGGAMLSVVQLAVQVPEGLGRLLDRDLVVLHRGRR